MNKFLSFCLGAAVGSVTTWYLVKKKYEKMAQEEIDSVKEVFSKRSEEKANEIVKDYLDRSIKMTKTAKDIVIDNGYEAAAVEDEGGRGDLYAINVEDFGEFEDYNQISLKCYADGIIVDSDGEVVEEVKEFLEVLDMFPYEDLVCIRDDMRCCDYEILRDYQSYEDYLASK